MEFPVTRLRRLRRTEAMRSLVREVHLRPAAFIYPLFICPGEGIRRETSSMPGVFNLSVDEPFKGVGEPAALDLGGRSGGAAWSKCPFSLMPPRAPPPSTDLSAKPPIPRPSSVTGAPIRWTE